MYFQGLQIVPPIMSVQIFVVFLDLAFRRVFQKKNLEKLNLKFLKICSLNL